MPTDTGRLRASSISSFVLVTGRSFFTTIGPTPVLIEPIGTRSRFGSIGGRFITADDLDGDGYPELVHSNNRSSNSDYTVNSYVYRGSASGFSTSRRYELPTESTYRHATADLDGDGYKEIIFSNYYDGSSYAVDSYIYWGSSSGYSSSDRTDLPVNGAWGEPVVLGIRS